MTVPESTGAAARTPSRVERFLSLFTEVRAGEGRTALLLLANVFLILCAYYFIKPAREGWLSISSLRGMSKLELRAFSGFSQGLLLALVVPFYARLTDRLDRLRLITRVNLFLAVNLVIFWLLRPGFLTDEIPHAGLAFYLWAGMFAVFVVAQFWAFAADLYSEEAGRRLFPLIAIGATGGAVAGAWIAGRLTGSGGLDSFTLLPLAALPLAGSVLLTRWADARGAGGLDVAGPAPPPRAEPSGTAGPEPSLAARPEAASPPDRSGAFRLVFSHRYLLATAILVVLFNWVSTTGDNVLFAAVQAALEEQARSAGALPAAELAQLVRNGTTAFYGDLYFWVNLCGFLLQCFVASRLLKHGGFKAILLALPCVALLSYSAMILIPTLAVIRIMKVAENSTNYSLNNTARHVLWLPTTREMKYKAKPAIDTSFARAGDALAALTVLVGTRWLALETSDFFLVNLGLILVWLVVAVVVIKERRRLLAAARSP